MTKLYISFIIISILISIVAGLVEDHCKNKTKTDCKTCLDVSGCAFCKNDKRCVPYDGTSTPPCSLDDLQFKTCIASAQTLLIGLGSAGGVLLIVIIIIIWCCCRRCKNRANQKELKKQGEENVRMEERRMASEARSADRSRAADQVRMKYGLLKAKDTSNDYKRMN